MKIKTKAQKDDEPPLDSDISRTALLEMAMVVLVAIIFLIIGIVLGSELGRVRSQPSYPTQSIQPANTQLIQGNTLIGYSNPTIVRNRIIADLGEIKIPYLKRIIFCESSFNPKAYNKKSGAKGLLQIIPSSERFCEKGLGRDLDMFDPEDNLECGEYLYKHGKLAHWKASEKCWKEH